MTTTIDRTVSLEVTHDGIRATALVVRGNVAATLDDVIEAALQSDTEGAADYAAVLTDIAPQVYLRIEKQIDGYRENPCCWYTVRLTHGIDGDSISRDHQITRTEFRTWEPTEEQVREETQRILRRATAIGLGAARYIRGEKFTFAATVA